MQSANRSFNALIGKNFLAVHSIKNHKTVEYLYWQTQDKKTLKRINQLIKDIERNGNEGIGKPEPLKENLTGFWSRRFDERHRIVYRIVEKTGDKIVQCKGHYADE